MRLIAVTLAVLGLLGAEPALADDFLVDDDRSQCPDAQFTSIQGAVDAAGTGGSHVITVCAGAYGPTRIPDDAAAIDLVGANAGRDDPSDASCLDPTFGDDPLVHSIVHGEAGRSGFVVRGVRVTIRGFTVREATDAAGVELTMPANAVVLLRENVIRRNTVGVRVDGLGENTIARIQDTCFAANNRVGDGSGSGILSDAGAGAFPLREVESNFFTGHFTSSVSFAGAAAPTVVSVAMNRLVRDAPLRFTGVGAFVLANRTDRSKGAGIVFAEGAHGNVESNKIRRCAGTGISLLGAGRVEVDDNNVARCDRNGIAVTDAAGDFKLRRNVTRLNELDGISLVNASGGTIRLNRGEDNDRDGLHVDRDSGQNLIEGNTYLGDHGHDCHDESVGSGTGGTANTWIDNVGRNDLPAGICSPPPA